MNVPLRELHLFAGAGGEENGHTPQLPEVCGGTLNPDWVEWLMGWPIGWTDLEPLETAKSPLAPPSRSEFYFQDWWEAFSDEPLQKVV